MPEVCRVLLVVALLAAGMPARADEDLRSKAIDITKAGAADYSAGRFDAALAKFEEAYRLVPAPPLMLNLSRTYLKLDRCDDSIRYAQMYDAVTPDAESKSWLADLQNECPAVEITTDPAGVSLIIAGSALQRTTPWSGHLRPHKYDVTLRQTGFVEQRMTLEVATGKPLNVLVKLVPVPPTSAGTPVAMAARPPDSGIPSDTFALPDAAPAAPVKAAPAAPAAKPGPAAPVAAAPAPKAPEAQPQKLPAPAIVTNAPVTRSPIVRKAGWVTLATGAAALLTAAILGATVSSDTSALGKVSPGRSGSQAQSDINSINGRATGANVLFGVGGGLAAAGGLVVVLW